MLLCVVLTVVTEVLWRTGHTFKNQALKSKRFPVHLLLGAVVACVWWQSLGRMLSGKHGAVQVLTILAMVSLAGGGLLTWASLCMADFYLSIRSESARNHSNRGDGESGVDENLQ